ncbi:transposase, partial [Clostridium lundense]
MGKRKERLTEGKKNIIADLIREYDIQSAEDIQDALKDLLGGTIESMLAAEMDNHLGYSPYERTDVENARNGKKQKTIRSKYGEM